MPYLQNTYTTLANYKHKIEIIGATTLSTITYSTTIRMTFSITMLDTEGCYDDCHLF
jgi:hypothetical protein